MKLIRTLLILLAVILGSVSVYAFLLGERLLSPSLYTEAFSSAGIYKEAAGIIESRVEEALITNSQELLETVEKQQDEGDTTKKVLIWLAEDIVEKKAGDVVTSISDRIGLEERLQSGVEQDITLFTDWLRGDRQSSDFFNIIPSVESVDDLEEKGLLVHLVRSVAVQSVGIQDLPPCESKNEEKKALELVADDKLEEVSCTTTTVQPLLEEKVTEGLPEGLVSRLEQNFNDFLTEYQLTGLWEGVIEILRDLAEVKLSLLERREAVRWYLSATSLGMSIAVVAGLLAVLFSPGTRVRTFINLNLVISGTLLMATVLFSLLFVNPILDSLNLERYTLTGDYVSEAQNAVWMSSVELAGENIVRGSHDYILQTGISWFLVSILMLGFYEYLTRGGWETWKRRARSAWRWSGEKLRGVVNWWDGVIGHEG